MKTKISTRPVEKFTRREAGNKNQGGIINENQQQHYGAKHSSPTFY